MPNARWASIWASENQPCSRSFALRGWISFQGKISRCQLTPATDAACGAKTACTAPNQGSVLGTGGSGLGAGLTVGVGVPVARAPLAPLAPVAPVAPVTPV